MERIIPGDEGWKLYGYEHQQRYDFFKDRSTGRAVLDAACGVGYGSCLLNDAGAASVVGIDVSQEAVEYARQHYVRPNLSYAIGDCEELPFHEAQFDLVLSFETIEHLHHPAAFIESVHRVLRPGGVFICSTPNIYRHSKDPDQLDRNVHHVSEMDFEEFEQVFSSRFFVLERYLQRETKDHRLQLRFAQEVTRIEAALQSTWAWRIEQKVRKLLKRPTTVLSTPLPLFYCDEGDFVIESMGKPSREDKTFILVGERG